MKIKERLHEYVTKKTTQMGAVDFVIEYPKDMSHGDFSTNIALVLSKQLGRSPREIADEIVVDLEKSPIAEIEKIEIAGPGFINFWLTDDFYEDSIHEVLEGGLKYGTTEILKGERIIFDHTDPNPFKEFHIGHLMSNAIGEAFGRLARANGADVYQMTYQGDVGLHVAKALWAMNELEGGMPLVEDSLADKVAFLGKAYAYGSEKYENNKEEIDVLNKNIYLFTQGDESALNEDFRVFYERGKEWSLAQFEVIYKKLNSTFDRYTMETEVVAKGKEVVEQNTGSVFEESEGAIVYKGEQDGLHTRVFINAKGVPTYESKDIGLAYKKEELYDSTQSFIVTASEQQEYMKVVYAAIAKIDPKLSEKFTHITHGMMRLADGKMSSRKGTVITGESLMRDMEEVVAEKMVERDFTADEKASIATDVAVAAIKYQILKGAPGRDIVFDREVALSTDGDSGPYIQYAYTRAVGVIEKSEVGGALQFQAAPETAALHRMLYKYPEIVERAWREKSPQLIVTYITEVAGEFNSFYAQNKIVGSNDESSFVALTSAIAIVLKSGLEVLGMKAPIKM